MLPSPFYHPEKKWMQPTWMSFADWLRRKEEFVAILHFISRVAVAETIRHERSSLWHSEPCVAPCTNTKVVLSSLWKREMRIAASGLLSARFWPRDYRRTAIGRRQASRTGSDGCVSWRALRCQAFGKLPENKETWVIIYQYYTIRYSLRCYERITKSSKHS